MQTRRYRGRPRGWKKFPLIKARRIRAESDGTPLLVFWCPFCKREHVHGAGKNPGDGDGHRGAHCHAEDSPFRPHGYILWEKE